MYSPVVEMYDSMTAKIDCETKKLGLQLAWPCGFALSQMFYGIKPFK